MKSLLITAALLSSVAALASETPELNLACVSIGDTAMETRQILVAEDGPVRAIQANSGLNAPVLRLDRYSVIIELVPGSGDEPATENFVVRNASEFTLTGSDDNYSFVDQVRAVEYVCGLNREVRANPALSRSN